MELPEIGNIIDNNLAIRLCDHFCRTHEGFCNIAQRIKIHPNDFKSWEFDGISMIPNEELIAKLLRVNSDDLLAVALRHDLSYGYGLSGERGEKDKLIADCRFCIQLVEIDIDPDIARRARDAVEVFGNLPTDYGWGFARK